MDLPPVFGGDVAASGTTAYVALLGDPFGFRSLLVIDATNPGTPTIVGSLDTPGYGVGIAVREGYVYLADGRAGLQVIDVANPAAPAIAGSVDTPGSAQEVALAGNYAYVADLAGGLQIIDITDPVGPAVVGGVATSGYATTLAVAGSFAYVGAAGLLHAIDITDPTAPAVVASLHVPSGGWCAGIAVSGNTAFVTVNHQTIWGFLFHSLWTIDISNPAAPMTIGDPVESSDLASDIAVSGDYALVTILETGAQGRIDLIDISNPLEPEIIAAVPLQYDPGRVALSGSAAYIFEIEVDCWGGDPCVVEPRPSSLQILEIAECEDAPVTAAVALNLDPAVINLGSRARWVTAYIEAEGFDVASIDLSSVRLAGSVPVAAAVLEDQDGDGTSDLTLKFTRKLVDPLLEPGWNTLEVTGSLTSGEMFRGADSVRVIGSPRLSATGVLSAIALPRGLLRFTTPKPGLVSVRLFDVRGRLVGVPAARAFARAGTHEVQIDGRAGGGAALSSGVYFYRVETDEGTVTGRIAIVK